MKAIAIKPKERHSAKVIELPKPVPKDDEVLVKVLEAGVCTTDREIYDGLYGEAPVGSGYLIMGHESLGLVESVGPKTLGWPHKGAYVVRTVRRPCKDRCLNCREDEQDMCLTGNFTETGIKGLHGVMAEYYVDKPENLICVNNNYDPAKHTDVGVLLEPLSFAEKAFRQAFKVQKRMCWKAANALVFGAGPIGLLEALILRYFKIDTDVVAATEKGNLKSKIVEEIGGRYFPLNEMHKLGKYDFIVEASGDSRSIKAALEHLGNNGVLALTSITNGDKFDVYRTDAINLDIVLGNKLVFGVVNSNREDYRISVRSLEIFKREWPGVLQKLITRRVPFTSDLDIDSLFRKEKGDIKVVLDLRGADGKA